VRTKGEAKKVNGVLIRVYGILQDIHDQKMREIERAQAEQ